MVYQVKFVYISSKTLFCVLVASLRSLFTTTDRYKSFDVLVPHQQDHATWDISFRVKDVHPASAVSGCTAAQRG